MATGLDPENPNPMYQLGRLVALIERHKDYRVAMPIIDVCLREPSRGLGMLGPIIAAQSQDQDALIENLMQRFHRGYLPDRIGSPAEQGPFWLGYWHQKSSAYAKGPVMTPEELRETGEALFGERWQADMAQVLGLHDTARLREWLRGARPIPRGISVELTAIARHRAAVAADVADKLAALLSRKDET